MEACYSCLDQDGTEHVGIGGTGATPATPAPPAGNVPGTDIVLVVFALTAAGFLLVWVLIIMSKREPGAMLSVSIALLSLVALGVYAVSESETAGTIAATGMGALAGSLTAIYRRGRADGEDT